MTSPHVKIAVIGTVAALAGAVVLVWGIVRSTISVNHGFDYQIMHASLWTAVLILLVTRAFIGLLPARRRRR
jgi:hypothetical protein